MLQVPEAGLVQVSFFPILDRQLEQFALPLQSANVLLELAFALAGSPDLRYMNVGTSLHKWQ